MPQNENPAAVSPAGGADSKALEGAGHQPNTTAAPAPGPAERLLALFAGNQTSHGTHGLPVYDQTTGKAAIKTTAKTVLGPPTIALWQRHLAGDLPLGVSPITDDEQGSCVWGSIDVDDYDVDYIEVINKIEAARLPLVACRSKSGGLHLFLFAASPVPASKMQAALRGLAEFLEHADAEVFPKQTRLVAGRDNGSWMVMPYYGDTYKNLLKWQHGIKRTGADMTVVEFCTACEEARVQPDRLGEILARRRPRSRSRSGGKTSSALPEPGDPFGDGPPCLQTLARAGIAQGGQNTTLFQMAVYYKRAFPESWKDKLDEANQLYCKPPHPSEGVASIIRSLDKKDKDYNYKCKDQPMEGVCNSQVCRMRKFGVGGGVPVIVGVRKIADPEDPVWFFTIEGSNGEVEIKDVKNFTKYANFTDQCAKQLNKIFRPVKQEFWTGVLEEAFTRRLVQEEPSPDTTPFGTFCDLLKEYLTNRQRGETKEDLLSGRPWEDEENGRHYFKMAPLVKFLERENVKYGHKKYAQWIREKLNGDDLETSIRGASVRLWWVPSKFATEPPDIPPPKVREGKI
jgi:hypothetical protein